MRKTTVYFPEGLKKRLELAAAAEGRSEADFIREAVAAALDRRNERPRPRWPLFAGVDDDLAERVDEYMKGFGED